MSDSQELQVQQKREVEKKTEGTTPGRSFVPVTDIFETPEALTVVLEMPGVDRNSIEASVENDVVTIEGRIDFSKYEGMHACRPAMAGAKRCRPKIECPAIRKPGPMWALRQSGPRLRIAGRRRS